MKMRDLVAEASEQTIARLRTAVRKLLLSRDASWVGGHDWQEAVDEAIAALEPDASCPCGSLVPTCGKCERERAAHIAETHPFHPSTRIGKRQEWLRESIAKAIRGEPERFCVEEDCDQAPQDGLRCWAHAAQMYLEALKRREGGERPTAHTAVRVRRFHKAFGHPVAEVPNPGDGELRALRVRLIAEELAELCSALGVSLLLEVDPVSGEADLCVEPKFEDVEVDLVEAADALADLDYVVAGSNVALGFPAEEIAEAVHHSNMSKLDPEEHIRALLGTAGRRIRICAKCGKPENNHPYRHPFEPDRWRP